MPTKNKSKDELEDLRESLQAIKDKPGIIGYILKGTDAASINLKDPSKIIDYAVLSATTIEHGESLADTFGLGEISSTVLEGANTKMLLLTVKDHRLSIFMEKHVDPETVCKALKLA